LILYSVRDSVMHLCPFCNRRTINLLDDDADDDDDDDATRTYCNYNERYYNSIKVSREVKITDNFSYSYKLLYLHYR